jgi:hypothetical protein
VTLLRKSCYTLILTFFSICALAIAQPPLVYGIDFKKGFPDPLRLDSPLQFVDGEQIDELREWVATGGPFNPEGMFEQERLAASFKRCQRDSLFDERERPLREVDHEQASQCMKQVLVD